jgi:hypothetical protein
MTSQKIVNKGFRSSIKNLAKTFDLFSTKMRFFPAERVAIDTSWCRDNKLKLPLHG